MKIMDVGDDRGSAAAESHREERSHAHCATQDVTGNFVKVASSCLD